MEVKPDLPAVGPADLREDLHARHRPTATREQISGATQLGLKVRALQAAGQDGARRAAGRTSTRPTRSCSRTSATSFGGRLKQADTGAAPIAQEILEFFYACGVPVLEGYGMTETATVATTSTVERPQARHRSAARCPGCEVRIADDGEVLHQGPEHLPAATTRTTTRRFGAIVDGWLHTGDLGSLDEDGYLYDHRPQEGHHHHRGRQEPHAGQPRERPQAVALDLPGGDVRRPPPVPGRADHARPRGDRRTSRSEHGLPEDPAALARRAEGPRADPGRARRGQREATRRSSRSRGS